MTSSDPAAVHPGSRGMIVKICGITNLEDARSRRRRRRVRAGIQFLSAQSARDLSVGGRRRHRRQTCQQAILKVGIFVNEQPAMILRIVAEAGLDIAQVIGDAPAGTRRLEGVSGRRGLLSGSTERVRGRGVPARHAFERALYGGTGHTFDWVAPAFGQARSSSPAAWVRTM